MKSFNQENQGSNNFKHSPLGLIPKDWEVKPLNEICDNFKSGNGITSENIFDKGVFPVYGGNGLRGFTNDFTHNGKYFLIGRQGALCGNIVRIEGKNFVSEHAIAVKTNEKNDTSFLAYKLEFQNLNRLSESSAQPGLSVEKLLKLKISIPPLSEQTAIANCLSTWDKAIQATTQLIAQKELQKKWLMQQLLTGKKRLKGFSGKVEFHVLGRYLKEISERNKENLCKRILSVTNSRGFINQVEQFDRVVASDDATNYKIVKKGQFAYNPSRINVGSLDLLLDFEEGILSPMYVVFETNRKILLPEFLYYHLKSYWFTGHIPMFVQGSVRDSLSFDGLCGIRFFIPCFEEQTAIAQVLKTADKEIQILKTKLAQLKEQKKGLMQVLLTGKKRLKI